MRKVLFVITCLFAASLPAQAPKLQLELVNQWWLAPISHPVDIQHAGDERLFVVEQEGRIRIVHPADGTVEPVPFLDISAQLGSIAGGSELGLLGLAFHPAYAVNGWFFVNYTDAGGTTVIKRFSRNTGNPNLADPSSGLTVMSFVQPFLNHNGGCLRFGPDAYLYIATGDGGWNNTAGDPENRAQNPNSLFGKILRIDVDAQPYTVPPDNPFVNTAGYLPEIWALGLRNPWRFEFDAVNGDLWLGDVGQLAYDEVNFIKTGTPFGQNFGWRCREGSAPYNMANCQSADFYRSPVFEYANIGGFCGASVIGGHVYHGNQYPGMQNWYICCDFCTGQFYGLYPNTQGGFLSAEIGKFDPTYNYSAFGLGYDGELYVTGYVFNAIYRVKDKCKLDPAPQPVLTVTDTVILSCSLAESYQWYFNGFPLAGATGQSYIAEESGEYLVFAADTSGCSSASAPVSVVAPLVATAEPASDIPLLYPNPASNASFFVSYPSAEIQIRIFDRTGRQTPAGQIVHQSSGTWEVKTSNLADGVYWVRLETAEGVVFTHKWVKL